MLIALTALVAVVLALVGVGWLPDAASRPQGMLLCAAAVILSIYAFDQGRRQWPRPEVEEDAAGPYLSRALLRKLGWVRWSGLAVFAVGLVLSIWALQDIWRHPFNWGQANRWGLGIIFLVAGAYLFAWAPRRGRASIHVGTRPAPLSTSPPLPFDWTPPRDYIPPPGGAPLYGHGPRPAGYKLRALGLAELADDGGEPPASAE
ncbi:MAG: hypothetical protein D6791_13205, partial [Chloroflexi bacterium]